MPPDLLREDIVDLLRRALAELTRPGPLYISLNRGDDMTEFDVRVLLPATRPADKVASREMTVVINGGESMDAVLVKRQEMIEYRSNIARKADPRWEFTDAAGHFHAYDLSRKNELPTLDARVEHVDCDGVCKDDGLHR